MNKVEIEIDLLKEATGWDSGLDKDYEKTLTLVNRGDGVVDIICEDTRYGSAIEKLCVRVDDLVMVAKTFEHLAKE